MHGIRQEDFYKNPEEGEAFKSKLEKGYKLLDAFVDYCSKMHTNKFVGSFLKHVSDSDAKMFELSSAIIEFMPEFTPSWNYRKKYIAMSKSTDKEVLVNSLMGERMFTQKSLKANPKSYSIWHHRLWTMSFLFILKVDKISEMLLEEYKLCFKLFQFDGRNFHCWSYLNYIIHYFKLLNTRTDLDKMVYEDIINLINENFSNYSAWFKKSNLSSINTSTKDDLELVKQVLYTDPKDQSIWNYYNWLFLVYTCYLYEKKHINLFFNSPVRLDSCSSGFYSKGKIDELNQFLDNVKVNGNWRTSNLRYGFEFIWTFEFESDQELDRSSKLELVVLLNNQTSLRFYSNLLNKPIYAPDKGDNTNFPENYDNLFEDDRLKLVYRLTDRHQVDLEGFEVFERDVNKKWVETNKYGKPVKLRNELVCLGDNITFKTLEEQLEVIDELISFDGESKYLLIAKLKLLEYLDRDEDFELLFEKLAVLDPLRKQYYDEMLTKYKASSISNIGSFLLLLETLDLSDNGVKSLTEVVKLLRGLPRLKSEINLSNTPICDDLASKGSEGNTESSVVFVYYLANMDCNKQSQKYDLHLYKIEK
ncbi:protein geranylgeranyltransferase type II [Theileria orientalis]|uniref:Geranylgeranyl transferase type-2 subunit alpha n=1 Tax=Theileria orientalis TaxID=68886 RepID=A0A976QVH1_THEOR|nr:protein geranylgeranyltransferase type II [Theileria orientalis]